MPTPSNEDSDLAFVADLMRSAVKVMAEFPADFVPPDTEMPQISDPGRLTGGNSVDEFLSDRQIQTWLYGIIDTWPKKFMPIFLQSSGILAQILAMFGSNRGGGMMDILALGGGDLKTLELMMALGQLDAEMAALKKDKDSEESDPMGLRQALMNELLRRSAAHRAPFARMLTTLLGQDALLWLLADSADGVGKMQPHEFSRTGWRDIWLIENQVVIEQELLDLGPQVEYLAKIVVALSWTLTGLASFISPEVFFGERAPHLSSERGGQYTVSVGTGTHTLVTFQPSEMLPLVRILADGLVNPLLSAADLMWIGAGLARVREVRSGMGESVRKVEEGFDIFLSHRGRDAKQPLSQAVQALQPTHGVFLDCLTLPRGVINRSFVYGSLARSERVLIVETENFNESEWCRKEAWFADAMARHGLASVERMTLPDAAARVAKDGPPSTRQRASHEFRYPIAPRVLSDIDYWARAPNLHSLKGAGYTTDSLAPLQAALEHPARPDDSAWVISMGEAVAETLSRVVTEAPDAEPFDLWATALQFSLAAFGSTSTARSKMEVRRGVDHLNAVLKSFVASDLHRDPVFRVQTSGHLALLAAAAAIVLAGFELDPRITPAIRIVLSDTAGLRDGLLLLDVREPGVKRDFRLRLIAILAKGNLGSVGIVQDAADEVHQGRVDEFPLEVLPCVTLYPGMDVPFGEPGTGRKDIEH